MIHPSRYLGVAKLNIGLTLPGQASLGAYEAGAVSALLVALQQINVSDKDVVTVDAITGSSSGSLTAVLAAGILLTGSDPVEVLRTAWVSEPSLPALQADDLRAPLSLDQARKVAHRLLAEMLLPAADAADRRHRAQFASGVKLEFAMTSLRGFAYAIGQRRPCAATAVSEPTTGSESESTIEDPQNTVAAVSYLDWARHRFEPGELTGFTGEWSAAVDSAIASASLPLAFPPVLLDTSENFRARGITNIPEPAAHGSARTPRASLWYSDGGLVNREPLGRCLSLIRDSEGTDCDSRLVLVVRPFPDHATPADDPTWTGEMDAPPRWRATLARALRVMTTHNLYEDLRKVEETNNRIAWTKSLIDVLGVQPEDIQAARRSLGTPQDGQETELANELQRVQDERLKGVLEQITADKQRLSPVEPGEAVEPAEAVEAVGPEEPGGGPEQVLRRVIEAAAGLENKKPVCVEVVAAHDRSDLPGATVGFVSERLRATSFLVGYREMLRWMDTGLEEYGIPAEAANEANEAARRRAAAIPGWIGEVPVGRWPPLRMSAGLLRVGVRAARIGLSNPRARARNRP